MPAGLVAGAAILAVALSGCAVRAPVAGTVAAAVAARGGPLESLVRDVEAEVYEGFPGSWRWRTVSQVPDRYAWSIETRAEPNHYLFDGRTVRAFIGTREVSSDPSPDAPLRSLARFMAVVGLDVLARPGVVTEPLPARELPTGAVSGLAITFDDGSRYRIAFDDRGLLVWAAGWVAVAPFGAGEVVVEFDDFRRTGRWWLPYRARWRLGGGELAVEHVVEQCPDPPGLGDAAFEDPARLPGCPPDASRQP